MECKIIWNGLSLPQWDARMNAAPHTTLLQSYPYAQAMRKAHQQGARHGLVMIDDAEAGLCQIQEVGLLGNFIHGVSLDRGPIWFKGFGKPAHWAAFLHEFDRQFPKGWLKKRRIMPEMADTPAHQTVLNESPFTRDKKIHGYQTITLDLTPDLETLRAQLDRKWRNHLNKSEKQGLVVMTDSEGLTLNPLLHEYIQDRLKRRYAGPSPKMIRALADFCLPRGECLILNALHDGDIIASVLILIHGRGATYQIGWSGPMGRDCNATYLLLWNAVKTLKERGLTHFDLGGVNDAGAAGVKSFKSGMKGHDIALIGQYS